MKVEKIKIEDYLQRVSSLSIVGKMDIGSMLLVKVRDSKDRDSVLINTSDGQALCIS